MDTEIPSGHNPSNKGLGIVGNRDMFQKYLFFDIDNKVCKIYIEDPKKRNYSLFTKIAKPIDVYSKDYEFKTIEWGILDKPNFNNIIRENDLEKICFLSITL